MNFLKRIARDQRKIVGKSAVFSGSNHCPTCHETGIKMAIHQDDPRGISSESTRLLCDKASIGRFLHMVDDPYNCLCLCSGSLGANPENDVADIIHTYCDRIALCSYPESRHYPNGDFSEVSHETVTAIPEFWENHASIP